MSHSIAWSDLVLMGAMFVASGCGPSGNGSPGGVGSWVSDGDGGCIPSGSGAGEVTTGAGTSRSEAAFLFEKGHRAYELGQYEQAIEILRNVRKSYPDDPVQALVHYYLGRSYQRLERFDDARAAYQAVVGRWPDSERADDAQYRIGETYYEQDNYAKAVPALQAVLTKYPGSDSADDAQYEIGRALHQQGMLWEARVAYQEVIEAYADRASKDGSDPSGILDDAQYRIAQTYYDGGIWEMAIAAAERVLSEYPSSSSEADVHGLLGLAHYYRGRHDQDVGSYDAARRDYQETMDFAPYGEKADDAQYRIGESYYEEAKAANTVETAKAAYAKAIVALQAVLDNYAKTNSADDAQYRIARCNHRLGNYASARAEYQKVIDAYPMSSLVDDAQYRIGRTYHDAMANCAAEVTSFEKLIEDHPVSPKGPTAQRHIDDIGGSRLAHTWCP